MISFIQFSERRQWEEIINSLPADVRDVYYLPGYADAFRLNGDGEPFLVHFVSETNQAVCVMFKRDVATDSRFSSLIEPGKYFDIVTPYGYGGFVFCDKPSPNDIRLLAHEINSRFCDENIVAAFFRFHPVLNNADVHRSFMNVIDLGKTIAMDLTSDETIWANITSKNRNMIRKAEKSGVTIHHGKSAELLRVFKEIYDETMRHDNAIDYYFFDEEFYRSIDTELADNYELFYAMVDGKIVSMSIMLFAGNQMHYHLSGSRFEYRNLAPSNLLLFEAAKWGRAQGLRTLHMGGGVGSGEDNLYKFKAGFNRNSDYQFSIGKMIVNPEAYYKLCALRGMSADAAAEVRFFPAYRG